MTATGQCLCGAVRYRATGLETHLHSCHCTMCRRWTGGPALAVSAAGVEFENTEALQTYASSDWAERGFCRHCGSNLFYRLKESGQTMLWAGALDDLSELTLAGEIFIDEKPPGYAFAGDHPRQTGAEFFASLGAGAD